MEKLDIAVGISASSRTWKNKEIEWPKLAKKLLKTKRTDETYAEYMGLPKLDQSSIKDAGGFVGGYLRGGRRKAVNLIHRQVLTLDLDFAGLDFWEHFTCLFAEEAILHTTHKHGPDNPRFRLILPLSREVSPDEYEAIGRKLAGQLGIELFDPTTFQPSRMMFWPTSSIDGVFEAHHQEGEWLDADAVLDSYVDWTDSSAWPISNTAGEILRTSLSKQEDPTEKSGLIGIFCRAYPIEEALTELLSEQYTPAGDGRFTYKNGTAAAGLVIYDDLFAFSHHGSDPCSGKLCNAFDLVRIHKFGHLDSGKVKDPGRQKSFKQMQEFVRSDNRTRKVLASEKIESAKYDFMDDVNETPEAEQAIIEENSDWMAELEMDNQGRYLSNAINLNTIFKHDVRLIDAFRLNVFDNKLYIHRSMPWRQIGAPEPVRNVDYSGLRNYIESIYGISGSQKIEDAMLLEFERNQYHPVQEYLEALEWDGQIRLDTFLDDYFGAGQNEYTKHAMRKMMVGAVKRVFQPGCKFDLVLTLVGAQGTGKSTLCSKLGGAWFSDTFLTVHGKEALEQIQGAWLIEMAELSGLRKAEVESIKHFITKQVDSFRPAYGKAMETYKRQCVFIGTTNKSDFLRDRTGDRRFLPVDVDLSKALYDIFDLPQEEVDQMWAEAVQAYRDHEPVYLTGEALRLAEGEQQSHSESDEREGIIREYLDLPLPSDWSKLDTYERQNYISRAHEMDEDDRAAGEVRKTVCVAEIWCECLRKAPEDMSKYNTREINELMKSFRGWEPSKPKRFKHYGVQRGFERSEK